MAKVEGIEPPTRGFGDRCSTPELHRFWWTARDFNSPKAVSDPRLPYVAVAALNLFRGAGDGIRTHDFHLGKVTLYH